jgi:hypothetical protein
MAEPQYFIKSEKTDHVAIHRGQALRRISLRTQSEARQPRKRRKYRLVQQSAHISPDREAEVVFRRTFSHKFKTTVCRVYMGRPAPLVAKSKYAV